MKIKNSVMQEVINDTVMAAYNNAKREKRFVNSPWRRLRYCSAEVAETENYYLLRSYNTIVAVIDKRTNELFDALRLVYGYTATSAQHITKFSHDYGAESRLVAYPV